MAKLRNTICKCLNLSQRRVLHSNVQLRSRFVASDNQIFTRTVTNTRFMSTASPKSTQEPAVIAENKFSIPQHYPSKLDRFTLIATRTLKAEDIGSEVSLDVMAKANTRRRIGVNLFLMIFTVFGSIWAVSQGKKEMKTNNIYEINKRR